jgi:hypothetical protein
MRVMWNLVLVCLEMELALVQDRCRVCIKHTIGSEIILDAQKSFWTHPMVLQVMRLKWKLVSVYLEIELILTLKIGVRFAPKHTIGLETVLDAPNGTP